MPIKSRLKDEIQLDHVFIIEPPRILNHRVPGDWQAGPDKRYSWFYIFYL